MEEGRAMSHSGRFGKRVGRCLNVGTRHPALIGRTFVAGTCPFRIDRWNSVLTCLSAVPGGDNSTRWFESGKTETIQNRPAFRRGNRVESLVFPSDLTTGWNTASHVCSCIQSVSADSVCATLVVRNPCIVLQTFSNGPSECETCPEPATPLS